MYVSGAYLRVPRHISSLWFNGIQENDLGSKSSLPDGLVPIRVQNKQRSTA